MWETTATTALSNISSGSSKNNNKNQYQQQKQQMTRISSVFEFSLFFPMNFDEMWEMICISEVRICMCTCDRNCELLTTYISEFGILCKICGFFSHTITQHQQSYTQSKKIRAQSIAISASTMQIVNILSLFLFYSLTHQIAIFILFMSIFTFPTQINVHCVYFGHSTE